MFRVTIALFAIAAVAYSATVEGVEGDEQKNATVLVRAKRQCGCFGQSNCGCGSSCYNGCFNQCSNNCNNNFGCFNQCSNNCNNQCGNNGMLLLASPCMNSCTNSCNNGCNSGSCYNNCYSSCTNSCAAPLIVPCLSPCNSNVCGGCSACPNNYRACGGQCCRMY